MISKDLSVFFSDYSASDAAGDPIWIIHAKKKRQNGFESVPTLRQIKFRKVKKGQKLCN
jgi:hypothetical protein